MTFETVEGMNKCLENDGKNGHFIKNKEIECKQALLRDEIKDKTKSSKKSKEVNPEYESFSNNNESAYTKVPTNLKNSNLKKYENNIGKLESDNDDPPYPLTFGPSGQA